MLGHVIPSGRCSILKIHRKRDPILYDYSSKGHTLVEEETSKSLKVNISQNLSWYTHIDKILKKGNSTLVFLRLNLRVSNEDTKSIAYKSLVSPSLEYCSSAPLPRVLLHSLESLHSGSD